MDEEIKETESTDLDNKLESIESEQSIKTEQPAELEKPTEIKEEPVKEMNPFEQKKPKSSKKALKVILFIIMVLILMGSSAAAAYMWRDKTAKDFESTQASTIATLTAEKASLDAKLAATGDGTTTTNIISTPCTPISPSAAVIENIEASITSGNTAALEGYMAASVNTILAATEAYGALTPSASVSAITDFITSDLNSWDYDFAVSASMVAAHGSGDYSAYFTDNSIVGKATNNKVISFSFDCNGKISSVFMAAGEELL